MGKDYNWKLDTPKQEKRYQKLTNWLIRKVQNNPSIIAYAMNHNATGYYGDQNPLKIDKGYSIEKIPEVSKFKLRIRKQALLAAQIAKDIDPTRPVYHHQSGSLGDMYTLNCYLNWAPRQERSDWLQHWSKNGNKPIFFVEWGLPHISSWSSYRGPKFIWRTNAFQRIWDSEFASAITNQKAFKMTKEKEKMQTQENKLWDKKKPHHWGGHLAWMFSMMEHNYLEIQSWFASDNWRSFRMTGASAMLPWDQKGLWKRISKTKEITNPERYVNLQQPGIVPDYVNQGSQYIYERSNKSFEPTSLGKTFLRWNKPIIAYIGGNKAHTTEKGCNFTPGKSIEKQLVIVNDSRKKITCNYSWELNGLDKKGHGSIDVNPGNVGFVPIKAELTNDVKPGQYNLSATFNLPNGEKQEDVFSLNIIDDSTVKPAGRIALFDPLEKSSELLKEAGIPFTNVDAKANLTPYSLLIIGKNALEEKNSQIDLSKVKHQLNILVFEQPFKVLTNRLGFRSNIHGLRRTFVRTPSHPALKGINNALLQNWRGAATMTPPYLQDLPAFETHDPKWDWIGHSNTRVWRCGNTGNTASVLIEKPPKGNWLPLIDGGFNLQYAPLLEYRDKNGVIVFCQMDVSSRTESEPAATQLVRNLVSYLDQAKVIADKTVYYAGNHKDSELLKQLGITFSPYTNQPLTANSLLVVGPQASLKTNLTDLVKNGANAICLGLNANEINKLMPQTLKVKNSTESSAMIEDFSTPEFKGISNSELYWRAKMPIAAIQDTDKFANKALKKITSGKGTIILSQLAPWKIDYHKRPYLRTTYRRNLFLTSRLLANSGAAFNTVLRSNSTNPLSKSNTNYPSNG